MNQNNWHLFAWSLIAAIIVGAFVFVLYNVADNTSRLDNIQKNIKVLRNMTYDVEQKVNNHIILEEEEEQAKDCSGVTADPEWVKNHFKKNMFRDPFRRIK